MPYLLKQLKIYKTKIHIFINIDTNYHSSVKGNMSGILAQDKMTFRIHAMEVVTGMTNYVMIVITKGIKHHFSLLPQCKRYCH